jgi:hypothetical protein
MPNGAPKAHNPQDVVPSLEEFTALASHRVATGTGQGAAPIGLAAGMPSCPVRHAAKAGS